MSFRWQGHTLGVIPSSHVHEIFSDRIELGRDEDAGGGGGRENSIALEPFLDTCLKEIQLGVVRGHEQPLNQKQCNLTILFTFATDKDKK